MSTRRSAARPSPAESSRHPVRAVRQAAGAAAPGADSLRLPRENLGERDRAGGRDILRRHLHTRRLQRAELVLFGGREENVAQLLGAPGAMMDSAKVDAAYGFHAFGEPVHALGIASDQNSRARVGGITRVVIDRGGDIGEVDVHLGRHRHSVQLLLPVARSDQVIHENQKSRVKRLAPTDHHLSMNQPVIDAVKVDPHQLRSTTISEAFPRSAADLAASLGETSVLKTKSRSVARLTPLTSTMLASPFTMRRAARGALPAGRSVEMT